MKRLWLVLLGVMIAGIIGNTPANATSVTNVGVADTTLTVVFGAPAEFDAVPMAKADVAATKTSASMDTQTSQVAQTVAVAAVPEPSTLILLGLGVLGVWRLSQRKRK